MEGQGSVRQLSKMTQLARADNLEALAAKILDSFPFPVQIFDSDGTAIMINQAGLEMFGIREEEHIGIYNAFQDPLVRDNGVMDQLKQVLKGKTVYLHNFLGSYQDMIKYFNSKDRDIKTIQADITCFPLLKPDGTVDCFIAIFFIKKIYWFRDEIRKGKEYLNKHWQGKYNVRKVAEAANLSVYHFIRLFKKHLGITPHDYYLNVKIRKIQEQLQDPNLTVAEAFAACGVDYHSHFAKVFKKKTGLSPSQYRKMALQEKSDILDIT
ncbi:MAG TPA: helix-turn-helix domain-containing protein [Peptococcaceae bacterium]|nr:helix-turn-helix domain-containing protein [Peptococcaceae bacterium]